MEDAPAFVDHPLRHEEEGEEKNKGEENGLDNAEGKAGAGVIVGRKNGLKNIHGLACEGSWKLAAEKCLDLLQMQLNGREMLACNCYYALALFKTRQFSDCMATIEEVRGATGVPNDRELSQEMPFLMHLMKALCAYFLENFKLAEELLHSLFVFTRDRFEASRSDDEEILESSKHLPRDSPDMFSIDMQAEWEAKRSVWGKRTSLVCRILSNVYLSRKKYTLALHWIGAMVQTADHDSLVISLTVQVLLGIGEVEEAAALLGDLRESLEEETRSQSACGDLDGLVCKCEGLVRFSHGDYMGASEKFLACVHKHKHDSIAANNLAVCHMYGQELSKAIKVLEESMQQGNASQLDETAVLNLCSMYELSTLSATEKKKRLRSWIISNGPDDFELAATKVVFPGT